MEKKGLFDLSLRKLHRPRENSLHIIDRTANSKANFQTKKQSSEMSCRVNNTSNEINTTAKRILKNNESSITLSPCKSTKEQLKASPRFGCSKDVFKDTQQQSCNIKIPISKFIKLISDIKVEETNFSFDLTMMNADFNIAQHNRKKKEFAKNQKEWDIEKNTIKKSLKIEKDVSSDRYFALDEKKEQNLSIDLSLIKTEFNIAQHNRKQKEFVKNQKEWDIEKNAIKKSLKIEKDISSDIYFALDKHLARSVNIHDQISRLNRLY